MITKPGRGVPCSFLHQPPDKIIYKPLSFSGGGGEPGAVFSPLHSSQPAIPTVAAVCPQILPTSLPQAPLSEGLGLWLGASQQRS